MITRTVTGERVVTAVAGFNPTYQRHVASYALCERFLPPGRVLDLGCGVGHSFALLAPRETVGLDRDAAALAGQSRETVVADMRALPFADGTFASVLAVQSLEHVPDPRPVLRECARVLAGGGVAVFVTPNRLVFARRDEVIDPYHFREYDPAQLRAACAQSFESVELWGIYGSALHAELHAEELRRLDRLLRWDPLRARRVVARRVRQRLYDMLLTRARRRPDARAATISAADFALRRDGVERAFDLVAVCRKERARPYSGA